jgi:hypothetical protein
LHGSAAGPAFRALHVPEATANYGQQRPPAVNQLAGQPGQRPIAIGSQAYGEPWPARARICVPDNWLVALGLEGNE